VPHGWAAGQGREDASTIVTVTAPLAVVVIVAIMAVVVTVAAVIIAPAIVITVVVVIAARQQQESGDQRNACKAGHLDRSLIRIGLRDTY